MKKEREGARIFHSCSSSRRTRCFALFALFQPTCRRIQEHKTKVKKKKQERAEREGERVLSVFF